MKKILTERNCVILLFAITFIAFALAVEDGKRLDKLDTTIWPTSSDTSSASVIEINGIKRVVFRLSLNIGLEISETVILVIEEDVNK